MSGTLVGGIGNVFLGDDGFGVEVVRRLVERPPPGSAHVVFADFGIRGFDLACALLDGYDDVILVDAMPRGGPAGTLYVVEPARQPSGTFPAGGAHAAHGLAPAQALALVEQLGGRSPGRLRIVGCEPGMVPPDGDACMGLSAPVAAAVPHAVALVERLLADRAGTRDA